MSRILLIEADPAERRILSGRIAELGHDVAVVTDGDAAQAAARAGGFDVVLLSADLEHGADAAVVCRRLTTTPQLHLASIVVYDRRGLPETEARMYEAGCEQYLGRRQIGLLEAVIAVQLRRKSRLDELADQARLLDLENRRLQVSLQRELDQALSQREGPSAIALRELSSSSPDGVLVCDAGGIVRRADQGAISFFGSNLPGQQLGRIAPASGLEAFVRDTLTAPRAGFRFDLAGRPGTMRRSLIASVIPLTALDTERRGERLVLLLDVGRRKVAEDVLRDPAGGAQRPELGHLIETARAAHVPRAIVGSSSHAARLREWLTDQLGRSGPVLVYGEAGTELALVARILHYGARRSGALVDLGCGSLDADALDTELFGCVAGAKPGISVDRPGLLLLAGAGTLVLDDVDVLPGEVQAKVAEALREESVLRAGARRRERIDCRVVATTGVVHGRPDETAAAASLSPELYALLGASRVRLAPLRERAEDLPALCHKRLGELPIGVATTAVAPDAARLMACHDWPGNLDELHDCLDRAAEAARGGPIEVRHLTRPLRDRMETLPQHELIPAARPSAARSDPDSPFHPPPRAKPWAIGEDDPISLSHYEKKALLRALDNCNGDKLAAARLLALGKSTFYRKLKRFGIE